MENKVEIGMIPVEQSNKCLPAGSAFSEDYLMLSNISEQDAVKAVSLDSEQEKGDEKSNREDIFSGSTYNNTWEVLGRKPTQRQMKMICLGLVISGLLCCILLLLTVLIISGRIATGNCQCSTMPGNKWHRFTNQLHTISRNYTYCHRVGFSAGIQICPDSTFIANDTNNSNESLYRKICHEGIVSLEKKEKRTKISG